MQTRKLHTGLLLSASVLAGCGGTGWPIIAWITLSNCCR